jgi:hypothetical protein
MSPGRLAMQVASISGNLLRLTKVDEFDAASLCSGSDFPAQRIQPDFLTVMSKTTICPAVISERAVTLTPGDPAIASWDARLSRL